jgi:hypothetical protein
MISKNPKESYNECSWSGPVSDGKSVLSYSHVSVLKHLQSVGLYNQCVARVDAGSRSFDLI